MGTLVGWCLILWWVQERVTIQLVPGRNGAPTTVQTSPLSELQRKRFQEIAEKEGNRGLSEWFSLRTMEDGGQNGPSKRTDVDRPKILGEVSLIDGSLVFAPKYPLAEGLSFEAELRDPLNDGDAKRLTLSIPKSRRDSTAKVEAIYPSADQLPQNLLRIYIQFNEPMAQGDAYRHIALTRSDGKKLEYPFLELAEELWDPSGRRLTLLLDPARVKQGLVPREEDGPVLEVGHSYKLSIRSGWPDVHGEPMKASMVKTFEVVPDDRMQPRPLEWKWELPRGDTRAPLRVLFPESLDHGLAMRCIRVVTQDRSVLRGDVQLSARETVWQFIPEQNWKAGEYWLEVDSVLEDVAGNSVERRFEEALIEGDKAKRVDRKVTRSFRIQP